MYLITSNIDGFEKPPRTHANCATAYSFTAFKPGAGLVCHAFRLKLFYSRTKAQGQALAAFINGLHRTGLLTSAMLKAVL